MNSTFRLWEYIGVDSVFEIGKFISDLTDYVNQQKYHNKQVILDMYPEGYNLHHNGVWAIIESVCRACDVHPSLVKLVIGDMKADYPCDLVIHQPRWLLEASVDLSTLKVEFSKVMEKKFLHFIGRATWDRIAVQMFLRGKFLSDCWTTMAPTKDRSRVVNDAVKKILAMNHPPAYKQDMIQYALNPPRNTLTDATRDDLITFPNNVTKLQHLYTNAFVEIVHETDIHSFFITEKTIRPILFKRPFIVMGCKDYMVGLKQLGFKTFDYWFDERYDQAEGRPRLDSILRRIQRIGDMDYKSCTAMNLEMQETIEHNYNHLINKGWLEHLDQFDVQFWHDGKGQLL